MTVPQVYVFASQDFDRFMGDFMAISMMETHHRAYAVVRAVLHVFRNHLSVDQALRFADCLPAVLRALFIEDWHPAEPIVPFPERSALLAEIRAVRRDHNLAGDSAIRDMAEALRRNVDNAALDHALAEMPPAARDYWSI